MLNDIIHLQLDIININRVIRLHSLWCLFLSSRFTIRDFIWALRLRHLDFLELGAWLCNNDRVADGSVRELLMLLLLSDLLILVGGSEDALLLAIKTASSHNEDSEEQVDKQYEVQVCRAYAFILLNQVALRFKGNFLVLGG